MQIEKNIGNNLLEAIKLILEANMCDKSKAEAIAKLSEIESISINEN